MRFLFIILILCFVQTSYSNEVTWYYPWRNDINNLTACPGNEIIPILKNGKSYRIMRVDRSSKIRPDFRVTANLIKVTIENIGVVKDYKGRLRLDLVGHQGVNDKHEYFLVSFEGLKSGKEEVGIEAVYSTNRKVKLSIPIIVGSRVNQQDLNVWAYFDYNTMLKGVKSQVIADLVSHHSNVLVIPPGYLPDMSRQQGEIDSKLKGYLNGVGNSFDYYILYLGYEGKNISFNQEWRDQFISWHDVVHNTMRAAGISKDKVILYPFDEPKKKDVKKFISFKDAMRRLGIETKLYVTISNDQNKELINYADIVQIYSIKSSFVEDVIRIKKKGTKMWLYEIHTGGKNIAPYLFRNIFIKTYIYNADGGGIWNYCDVGELFDDLSIKSHGSWSMNKNAIRDNSLIYRKGTRIYSSLRWKILSSSSQEVQFLKLVELQQGQNIAKDLANKLINMSISPSKWEEMKVALLTKMI